MTAEERISYMREVLFAAFLRWLEEGEPVR